MEYNFTIDSAPSTPRRMYGKNLNNFLYETRKRRIREAQITFPDEKDLEEAYRQLCRLRGISYITQASIHEYAAHRQKYRDYSNIKLLCASCGKESVTVDLLCRLCKEYANGKRYSLYCQSCHETTYSVSDPTEVHT